MKKIMVCMVFLFAFVLIGISNTDAKEATGYQAVPSSVMSVDSCGAGACHISEPSLSASQVITTETATAKFIEHGSSDEDWPSAVVTYANIERLRFVEPRGFIRISVIDRL